MTYDDTDDTATLPEYYSVREYAELRGVSRGRVDQWIRDGRLLVLWIGDVRVIPRAAGDAFTPNSNGRPRKGNPTT